MYLNFTTLCWACWGDCVASWHASLHFKCSICKRISSFFWKTGDLTGISIKKTFYFLSVRMLISQFILDRWNNSHPSYLSALQLGEVWGFFLYFHLTPCRVLHCCVINWPEFHSAPSDTAWLLWFKCWLRTLLFCAQPASCLVPCDEIKGPCTEPPLQLIFIFSTSDTGGFHLSPAIFNI